MDEHIMRSRIDKELLDNYDKSTGFDLIHLDTFKHATDKLEIENLVDDPAVHVYEIIIPSPNGIPDIKLRIYEPSEREQNCFHADYFFMAEAFCLEVYTDKMTCVLDT